MGKTLTFVTGNANKLKEFVKVMGDINVVSHAVDLPELQGEPDDISREKCKLAAEAIQGPVCVEDTSLCFNALNGLPGSEDKSAYALCTFSYTEGPGQEIFVFRGETPGTIVPRRGPEKSFGWDPIFQPDGFDKTYAEIDMETKNSISHRGKALEKLRAFFTEKDLFQKQ